MQITNNSSGSGVKVNLIKGVSSEAIAEALIRINEQELNIIGYESQTKAYRDETSVLRDNTQVSANNAKASELLSAQYKADNENIKTNVQTLSNSAYDSANTASIKANEAIDSAIISTTQANISIAKASEASTYATNSNTSAVNALASENKAEEWANKGYGLEVEPGLYSAKHYAIATQNELNTKVDTTTNQTISGVKIFTSTPKIGTDDITSISTSVTDNAIARYDGTTGKLQNSGVVVDDSGNVGIGVTPSAKLHIGDGSDNSASVKYTELLVTSNDINWSNAGTSIRTNRTWLGTSWLEFMVSNNSSRYSAITLNTNGNLLVGTSVDNGVDKLQVNGSINCNNKIVYQNGIIGTFTGDGWYDTGVTMDTLGYNILDTFAITIYEDSFLTGNNNYQMLYKFIVGSASSSSNSGNTFDIPTLSAVGHAHGRGSVSLRWQHLPASQPQKIQFKVTHTSTFDNSVGKALSVYVTKLI